MQLPTTQKVAIIGAVIARVTLMIILWAFAYRITVGVNLSDESYYATFVDGWLKDGLCCSSNLVLHQTAELIVLPFAWLYKLLMGGEQGLILFLRAVFMVASCIAGFACYALIRRIRDSVIAFCSALFVICFVPFSLPAPSYNTIGMLAMLCSLSLFGMAALPRVDVWENPSRLTDAWVMILSGFAWMVTIIAYPTLVLALLMVFGLAALLTRGTAARLLLWRYGIVCVVWQGLGACLLLAVYGWTRLIEILRFTDASMRVSDGLAAKVGTAFHLLSAHPGFLALCLASAAVGFLPRALGQDREPDLLVSALLAAIVLAASVTGPVLFFRGHDIVILLALSGLGGVMPQEQREPPPPIIRAIYAGGLLAGFVTAATATNGLYNFAIGGFPAAVLGPVLLISRTASMSARTAHSAMLLTVALATGVQAFIYVYGESANPLRGPAVRIPDGVFAGLLTSPDQALLIAEVTQLMARVAQPRSTVLVLGRLPGLYLLTSMSPDALATWDFSQFYGSMPPQVDAWMRAFYQIPDNWPDVIAVLTDPWTHPPQPWATHLLTRYLQTQRLVSGHWSLVLYKRCAGKACAPATAAPG